MQYMIGDKGDTNMDHTQFTKPLSEKQKKLVVFIYDYIQKNNYPPNHDEMREVMGVKSVNNQIASAAKKGWLVRDKTSNRRNIFLTSEGEKRIDSIRIESEK